VRGLVAGVVLGGLGAVLGVLVLACSSSDASDAGTTSTTGDSSIDRARLAAPLHPDASCAVEIDTPPLLPAVHVVEGTVITYSSNPPSSGPHYPIWANFQEFTVPIDDGYLVHSLEHGAILLLYKCDEGAACTANIDALRKIRDAFPSDPLCDPSIRVRFVLAPYPTMDVPVAAVAWGWTYKAQCVDVPTLTQFATDHYAQGPEQLCGAGMTF
jgi:hypothetical protein